MTTPDDIRSLAGQIDAIPPFPEVGMAWQTRTLHNMLRDVLNVAASEPASPVVTVLVDKTKEYIEAINRGVATIESFDR